MTTTTAGPSGRALLSPAARAEAELATVPASTILLLLAALGVAGVGLVVCMAVSQATIGVGLVGGACLIGITARIAQAAGHHRDIIRALHATGGTAPESSAVFPPSTPEERAASRRNHIQVLKIIGGIVGSLIVAGVLLGIAATWLEPKLGVPSPVVPTAAVTEPVWTSEQLRNVIVSIGEPCQKVERLFYQGLQTSSNTQFWSITCLKGNSFAVGVRSGFPTRIVPCEQMNSILRTACFEKMK